MKWTVYVARMVQMGNAYKILVGKPDREKSEDLGVDGGIILQ